MLARTDGKSPAQFLDPRVERAGARGRNRTAPGAGAGALAVALIASVHAWEALDSRGMPTIGCVVRLADGSEGGNRAVRGLHRYARGARAAGRRRALRRQGRAGVVASLIGEIAPALGGLDAGDQAAVDGTMRELDGTANLARLGANAVLAASVACALAHARSKGCRSGRRSVPTGRPCCLCRWST